MAASEPNYDAMDLEMDEAMATEAEAGALDDELMMHAEAAGFDATKAEALKAFVERCVELKGSGSYDVVEEDEETEDEV
jgi:hypothetical protein